LARLTTHEANNALQGDESLLLNHLAQGCPEAFRSIYDRYQPRLQLFIYPFTAGSKELCNEIIQEVFIKLWVKRREIIIEKSLEFYLLRMARNQLVDHARLRKIKWKHERAFAAAQSSDPILPEEELQLREYLKVAREAVNLLPARRSSVFQLNVLQGYSLDEVSDITGLSKEVVKKQLFKAKRFILKYLHENGGMDIPAAAILVLPGLSFFS